MEKHYIPPDIMEIPDIKLYMDQMIEYLEVKLEPLKDDDKAVITKTMVNNYVKAGLIAKPFKKKYSKDQLMDLLMACHFKNVLSIDEIIQLFKIKEKSTSNDEFYLSYRSVCLEIEEGIEKEIPSSRGWVNLIRAIIKSDYHKRQAKKYLKFTSVEVDIDVV
ncbi:DUF1836 domain-containing protein [Alkalibacter mobilis]|uniref:DUF1836 domain-containing protein n=1 Tax=Alkalibacter mobilis TaxID=2787712 RepID=UPI00189D7924|nr:DUF1836 domain-containing protein [Alkalibacter mobilis]MBF7096961.1 DUF1836 domain-containing protein [Alkalibacter mobilis]